MFDLDSTLASTIDRGHLAPRDRINGDWAEFSNECLNDKPIEGTVKLARMLYRTHRIVVCSGRDIRALHKTQIWLAKYEVPYDELYLCDYSQEYVSNGIYKAKHVQKLRERGYNPVLFVEDWPASAECIEAVGVDVLCINPRYESNELTHDTG